MTWFTIALVCLFAAHETAADELAVRFNPEGQFTPRKIEECEPIRYEGGDALLIERLLEPLIPTSHGLPDVSYWPSKYSARWEIRDRQLYIVDFNAKVDHKLITIDQVIPGAKLNTCANWVTARLHVITGPHYSRFTTIDILDITKGNVVHRTVWRMADARDLLERGFPIVATFSIVAADPETGVCGAAVASKYPAVGKVVPIVRADVGAFCTQHYCRPEWRETALNSLADEKSPSDVLAELLARDDHPGGRQLAIINMQGVTAVHNPTAAEKSSEYWGAMSGRFYSCQGNTLAGRDVIVSMAKSYEETKGSLADRMMAALIAGDCAGGDHRGRLAAGIRVAKTGVDGTWLELDVDESDDAVRDLARKYAELKHEAKGEWRGAKLPFDYPAQPNAPKPRESK